MAASTAVPSQREIELADYKLGSFFSDLDVIEAAVERLLNPMTPEEFLALEDDPEREAKLAALPEPTFEDIAPLLLFAADLQNDASELQTRAAKIEGAVLALAHSASDRRRQGVWNEYRAAIAEWHAESAAFYRAKGE